jgi:hypothetical protein
MVGINGHKTIHDGLGTGVTEEDAVTDLPASALASVLKWSKDIAADIHLFSGSSLPNSYGLYSLAVSSPTSYGDCNWSAVRGYSLRRADILLPESSGAQSACIVITGTGGEYQVATSMTSPSPCKVHECVTWANIFSTSSESCRHPISVRAISDPLQRAVILHCS